MTEPTKIDFRYRRIQELQDVTDLVAILFPGNLNQQHAAVQLLLELKSADGLLPSLKHLEERHGISRRTLERTRAKLGRLGMIEHHTWLSRYAQDGWKLSGRMSTALRQLGEKIDHWRTDARPERMRKDRQLTELIR